MSVLIGAWLFPTHWKLIELGKPRFTNSPTILVFEVQQEEFIWTSRRHRRGRNLQFSKYPGRTQKFRFYGYRHAISYWADMIFLIGFMCMCIVQICKLVLCTHENYKTCRGTAQLITVQILLFISNGIFFIGGYLVYGEVINQRIETIKGASPGLEHHLLNKQRRYKLIGWRPKEICFWSSVILLIGVILFILHVLMEQIHLFKYSHVANAVGSWIPAILAASCFTVSSYLNLVEQCHSWLPWKSNSMVFWLLMLRLLASLIFVAATICGVWWNDTVRLWGSKVMFLVGSVLFVISFYLGILEVLN